MKLESIIGFDLNFPAESLKAALVVSLLSVWVLIGLFYYLNRYTRRHYFTVWTGAWLFYAVWLILKISFQGAESTPLLEMLSQWCLCGTVVLLLWGSVEFLQRLNRPLIFGLFVAFLLVWSYVGAYHLESRLQSELPVFGLIGLASLLTAYCFFRFRLTSRYLGAGLLAFGFAVWGIHLCAHPFVQNSGTLASASFFSSAVLQLFIAVSMIVLVLEEVRNDKERIQQHVKVITSEKTELQSEVAQTGERYQQLFQQAKEGIILVQAQTLRILEMNRAAELLLGLPLADAAGAPMTDFITGGGNYPAAASAAWFDWLAGQDQVTVKRLDGSQVQVDIKGGSITWDHQPAFQLCLYDLTERIELDRRLRQTEKLTALGGMIAGVAHELNNPLAIISGYTQMMLARQTLAPHDRTDLEKIANESNHAAKLVGDFLACARQHELHLEPTSLNQIAGRVAEVCRYNPLAKGVAVELNLDQSLPPVNLEPDQVELAVNNLVVNALQAMMGQKRARRLRVTTQRLGEMAQITVEDSGPGVPELLATKIFEPFFTTKKSSSATGLGLSIVHSIIAAHHGQVTCQPSALGGAALVVKLPLVEIESAPTVPEFVTIAGESAPAPVVPVPIRTGEPLHIMVLDDEKVLADMMGQVVKLMGHQPTVCTSPEEALKAVKRQNFELIISDYRMPGMSGDAFYDAVTTVRPELAYRILFLTGDAVSDDSRRFFQTTGVPYLDKPCPVAKIREAINTHLHLAAA